MENLALLFGEGLCGTDQKFYQKFYDCVFSGTRHASCGADRHTQIQTGLLPARPLDLRIFDKFELQKHRNFRKASVYS